jgi:hypothetical protein
MRGGRWCYDNVSRLGRVRVNMIAAVFEFIAEERCRQRCLDKAGGDEVDSDGRELLHPLGRVVAKPRIES